MAMARFTLPRDIYYGKGALEALKSIKGKRAFIVVGGGSMKRFGFLDKVVSYLNESGIQTALFENVEPDPSVETVQKGAAAMRDFAPDWIIAIGGGSPIDAAKAMWVFYEHPESVFEDMLTPFSIPELRQKAKFIAIPSTSGTASEVTAFSVITDYSTGIKYPLGDYTLTPDIAVLDPELAETMPPTLTAHTGLDALTHAVEAYVSAIHSPMTDALALKAIQMIFQYLPASYAGDAASREQMHYAQCMAGMAFANALLGIVHSLAHKTGAAFSQGHIPHGCANAIYLPYVIQYNRKTAESRYAEIGRALGLSGSDSDVVDALLEKINAFNAVFSIPTSLQHYGVDEQEFKEKAAQLAELAVGDACTMTNPRPVTAAELKELLVCMYYGKTVDF